MTNKIQWQHDERCCGWCGKKDADDKYVRIQEVWSVGEEADKIIGCEDEMRFCNRNCMKLFFTEP